MNRPEAILQAAVVEAIALTEQFTPREVDINPKPKGFIDPDICGHPDLRVIGYTGDRQFDIELKAGKGKLSANQVRWHERHRLAGGSVYVARNVLQCLIYCALKSALWGYPHDRRLVALIRGLL